MIVSVTPTDILGNTALPTHTSAPMVSIDGVHVAGNKDINDYSGTIGVEIAFQGRQFKPDTHGRTIAGTATVKTSDGGELKIKSGKEMRVDITIGGAVLHATFPSMIGNKRTHRAFKAGTKEAMEIPLADREPFMNEKEAKAARYMMK